MKQKLNLKQKKTGVLGVLLTGFLTLLADNVVDFDGHQMLPVKMLLIVSSINLIK